MTLFPKLEQRLLAVRTLALSARDVLILFCIVDEHIHALLLGHDPHRKAVRLWRAVQEVSEIPLEPPHVVPVETRRHLENLVPYVLTQPKHHGLRGHPALWAGSCFPDLIGARELRGFAPTVLADALPRRPNAAWDALGLTPFAPLDNRALQQYGPGAIVRAAAAAVGHHDLDGTSNAQRRARRAVAVTLHQLGYHGGQIADALQVTDRAARRLASGPTNSLERCIRMQLALREHVVQQSVDAFDRKQLVAAS